MADLLQHGLLHTTQWDLLVFFVGPERAGPKVHVVGNKYVLNIGD